MRRSSWAGLACLLLAAACLLPAALAQAQRAGEVTLPLGRYGELLRRLDAAPPPKAPPIGLAWISRNLEGELKRGLCAAKLEARFAVMRPQTVPLIASSAAIGRVLLDGKAAAVVQEGGMHAIHVRKLGRHEVLVQLYVGRPEDRYARRLRLRLPRGGTATLGLWLDERGIDARLAGGVVMSAKEQGERTRLEAQLDGSGAFDLRWTRRAGSGGQTAAKLSARSYTLFTVGEALVRGIARFDVDVRDGETDRLDFRLPADVEVLAVRGEAVLQWQSSEAQGKSRRLSVLLRYLARGRLELRVELQRPAAQKGSLTLGPIALLADRSTSAKLAPGGGVVGIAAPAALAVDVTSKKELERLELRDLPGELTGLTRSPLLHGFRFKAQERPFTLGLRVARLQAVALTSTLIDAIEASTVLLENGDEVTKVRLRMRNNTRQYLTVQLPPGAELIGAQLDGHPSRPARATEAQGKVSATKDGKLLFALRQSERVEPKRGRLHRVRRDETLGDIAHRYYSDPAKWPLILEHNRRKLRDARGLRAGQLLRIPSAGPVTVEESSFVLELAYRLRHQTALGRSGQRTLGLPKLDVDALRVHWHLYLPGGVVPLRFEGNLEQLTAPLPGPFRRLLDYLRSAVSQRRAWAGGATKYKSILSRRKTIFRAQADQRRLAAAVPVSFPLVGQRYRFRRILLQRKQPVIVVSYVSRDIVTSARWLAFGLAAIAAFLLACWGGRRRLVLTLACLPLAIGALYAAHHLPGLHRRLIWGVAVGLFAALYWPRRAALRASFAGLLWAPWSGRTLVRGRTLLTTFGLAFAAWLALALPLLLSTIAALTALLLLRRAGRATLVVLVILSLSLAGPTRAWAGADGDRADFDTLLNEQNAAPRRNQGQRWQPGNDGAVVRLPLVQYTSLYQRLERQRRRASASADPGPAVLLAEARYEGEVRRGMLHLRLELRLELGRAGRWKLVPLVGRGASVLRASVAGRPVALATRRGYHVWPTQQSGAVTVKLDVVVAPQGPRGSSEFSLRIARTPVTTFRCTFPKSGVEPRIEQAVAVQTKTVAGRQELEATLRPTTRLRLQGFRDLGSGKARAARLYAETLTLLSIDEDSIETFSVLRYTILYAAARELRVRIPAGMTVVSAEGPGGFHYRLEEQAGSTILRGRSAAPLRGRYELSLRLRRSLAPGQEPFVAPLPRCLDVARSSGWVAVEVTGRLRLGERSHGGLRSVDPRQLPPEMLRSAVNPILRAYRHHDGEQTLKLVARRLPEAAPPIEGIDRARAFSVVSTEGDVLTELRLELRNRLRRSLRLKLRKGATVRSVLLDGAPVKPSRDGDALVLPLRRSGERRDQALILQVTFADRLPRAGWLGQQRLALPAVSLPISTLAWSVYLPGGHSYGALGGQGPRRHGGGWLRTRRATQSGGQAGLPPNESAQQSAGSGAMPVRIRLPKRGLRREYLRYWIAEGQPAQLTYRYLSHGLAAPLIVLCWLGIALCVIVGCSERRRALRGLGCVAALGLGLVLAWPLRALSNNLAPLSASMLGLLIVGWRQRWPSRTVVHVGRWARTLRERYAVWRCEQQRVREAEGELDAEGTMASSSAPPAPALRVARWRLATLALLLAGTSLWLVTLLARLVALLVEHPL